MVGALSNVLHEDVKHQGAYARSAGLSLKRARIDGGVVGQYVFHALPDMFHLLRFADLSRRRLGVGQGIGIAQPTAFEFFRGSLDGRLHAAAIGNEPLVRLRMAEVLPESAIEVLHDSGYYQILFRGKYLVHRSNRDSAALCNLPYGNGGDAIFICNVVRGLDQVISIDLICSHERSRLLWGRNGRIVPIVLFFDAEGNERTFLPWRERCLGLRQLVAGTWSAFHSVGTQTDYGRFKRRMRLRWTASVFRDSTIFCNAALNVFLSSALFAK